MQETHELDAAWNPRDPWGTEYAVECQSDEVIATSAGPDRNFRTADDIRAPAPRSIAGVASNQR
jgi:hypothetical protein